MTNRTRDLFNFVECVAKITRPIKRPRSWWIATDLAGVQQQKCTGLRTKRHAANQSVSRGGEGDGNLFNFVADTINRWNLWPVNANIPDTHRLWQIRALLFKKSIGWKIGFLKFLCDCEIRGGFYCYCCLMGALSVFRGFQFQPHWSKGIFTGTLTYLNGVDYMTEAIHSSNNLSIVNSWWHFSSVWIFFWEFPAKPTISLLIMATH